MLVIQFSHTRNASHTKCKLTVADLGKTLSAQGFDPLPIQRVSLCTSLRYPLLDERFFWSKLSEKCMKTPFWPVFFDKVACGIVILESSENQFGGDLEKFRPRVFFSKISPRVIPRSAPASLISLFFSCKETFLNKYEAFQTF